jgi:Zn-dependent peptidase ImmA (M78 family)/transcriptional regulator with XRE-family HTH domain
MRNLPLMPTDPSLGRVRLLFEPGRLGQARLARGMKMVDLADKVGVTPAAIGQYEAGYIKPSAEVLGRLAVALGFPVAFFESGRPMGSMSADQAHFRRLRSVTTSARNRQIARLALLEELVARVERDVELPSVDIPIIALQTGERDEVEAVAAMVRSHWGLGDGPLVNVIALLESKGCVVVRLVSESEGIDAYSRWSGPRPVIVLTMDKDDAARSNFDAAHELAHLVLHRDPQPGSRVAEEEAQMFASAFLMPADAIRPELPTRFDLPEFVALKHRWRVSIQALLYRARTLGTVSEPAYKRAMIKISMWGWRTGEPNNISDVEEPYVLAAAIALLRQDRGLDAAEIAKQVAIPMDLMEDFVVEQRPRLRVAPPPGP